MAACALSSISSPGDPASFASAFTAVYEEHHQALYRYCRSILRDEEDARDALQSTFAKAYAALLDEPRRFELRPWLFRIAHNESISLIRRRRSTEDLETAAAVGTDSLSQEVETREELRLLQADLGDLAERHRSALLLRELSGLGHDEIAAVLETTPRAVKQVIFEARSALQDCREGRAMACDDVQRAVSDGDGRKLRGRRYRAHLRSCGSCRAFQAAMGERPAQLAALAPALPLAASAAILERVSSAAAAAKAAGAAGAGMGAGAGAGIGAGAVAAPGAAAGAASAGGVASAATGGLGALVTSKVAVLVVAVAATATGGAAALTGLDPGSARQAPADPAVVTTGTPAPGGMPAAAAPDRARDAATDGGRAAGGAPAKGRRADDDAASTRRRNAAAERSDADRGAGRRAGTRPARPGGARAGSGTRQPSTTAGDTALRTRDRVASQRTQPAPVARTQVRTPPAAPAPSPAPTPVAPTAPAAPTAAPAPVEQPAPTAPSASSSPPASADAPPAGRP